MPSSNDSPNAAGFDRFVAELLAATRAGRLRWVSIDDGSFELKGESGIVSVWSGNSGRHPFTVELRNNKGVEIESMSTSPGDFYHPWERRFADLHAVARSSALDIPGTIQGFRSEFGLDDFDVTRELSEDSGSPF